MKYKKVINFILQTIEYFIIIWVLFFLLKKVGINRDMSILPGAIGSTFGWVIVRLFSIKKESKKKKSIIESQKV